MFKLFMYTTCLIYFSLHADQELLETFSSQQICDSFDDELNSLLQSAEQISKPVCNTKVAPQEKKQPAQPTVPDHSSRNHFALYGDYLYWQPFCNDNTWGIQQTSNNSFTQYRFNFAWSSGFRLGAQYKASWEDFSVDASWTCFHTSSQNSYQSLNYFASSSSPPSYSLQNLIYDDYSSGTPWKITSKYHLIFDQIDLYFKKSVALTKMFTTTPFIGPRALIIEHKMYNTRYSNEYGITKVTNRNEPMNYSFIHQYNNTNAYGLVTGVSNELAFGKGFGFYFTGDLFVGWGKNISSYRTGDSFQGQILNPVNLAQSSQSMKSMLDIQTGFMWKKTPGDSVEFLLSLGYEFHYIFASPTFLYVDAGSSADPTGNPANFQDSSKSFGFQGLTVRAGLGF